MLWTYGQQPYSSLKLLNGKYEWIKDSAQKLIRTGYVGVVKAKSLKSLYLMPDGREKFIRRDEAARPLDKYAQHIIVYDPQKATRTEKVNQAAFIVGLAGMGNRYRTSREIKAALEARASRGSDKLKYSRFVGIYATQQSGMVVYHFGKNNINMNKNGELNAKIEADRLCKADYSERYSSALILGDTVSAAIKILEYSDKLAGKSGGQLQHLKTTHFNLTTHGDWFNSIMFLPVHRDTPLLMRMMYQKDWQSGLYYARLGEEKPDVRSFRFLDCRMTHYMYCKRELLELENGKLRFCCYRWQADLLREYLRDVLGRFEVEFVVCEVGAVSRWVRSEK